MHKGQLASLPAGDGRRTERRVVNLAASLREPGAAISDAEVMNLSTDGFMAQSELPLEQGQIVYLKLPGLEALKSRVAWVDGNKAGFEFTAPLHRGLLDQLTANEAKPIPRGHFGPRRRY
jgi:hypothetical protein